MKEFQFACGEWSNECFGGPVGVVRRNHRFLEESIELFQALGCSAKEAHQLVDYVFSRPVGDPQQELGGTMVTLGCLANEAGLNIESCARNGLADCWNMIEQIRAKDAAKPKLSPLPGPTPIAKKIPVRLYAFYNWDVNKDGAPFALCDDCRKKQPIPPNCCLNKLADAPARECQGDQHDGN